ncbi:HNH endonuclease [Segatella paludivivens]|uniref:HNH endonuclease n=1 Tax=Segatella paludivivens TaxID=185294 RepID=UPI00035CEF12|nr:HNH endonuclease [Segatella paludivivens]
MYIKTGKCIWCGMGTPEVTFDNQPHIVPRKLGGREIGFDICDECNHAFGAAKQGKPAVDLAFKEVFQAFIKLGHNLNANTYKSFSSIFFSYHHSKHTIKIRSNFRSDSVTRQFKRGLYEVFLQKYHKETGNGNHPMFDVVRKFARYDIGDLHVFYAFNNILLVPQEDEMLKIPMGNDITEKMLESGMYEFWMAGHIFFLEVFPIAFMSRGYAYLQKAASNYLINVNGNERIFEINNILDVDIFMQRFNSK